MEKAILMQQQEINMSSGAPPNQQRNYDEIANLEEAFRYQEMELQKERENSNNMQM